MPYIVLALIVFVLVEKLVEFLRKRQAKRDSNVYYMNEEDEKKKFEMPNFKFSFKKVALVILAIVLFIFIQSSFFTVDQTEYAFITTFGKPSGDILESGLKFKLPSPIQKVHKLSKETFSMQLGYDQNNDGKIDVIESESKMITGDENIILADLEVQWRIVDPIAYTYNTEDPKEILKNATSSSLRNVIGNSLVDDALTDGRTKIIGEIRESLIELVDHYKMGVAIVNVNLQDVDLPNDEVDRAFKAVTDAREERITKVNEANKYKNEKLNQVQGEAKAILSKAEGEKIALIEEAKGNVASFNALYSEYTKNPNVTRQRLSIETLKNVYKDAKIMIVDSNGSTVKYLPINDLLNRGGQNVGNN